MSKQLFLLPVLCLCIALSSRANEATDSTKATGKFGVVGELGSTPGIELAYRLHPKVTARLGVSYLVYELNSTLDVSGEPLKLVGDLGMSFVNARIEFLPFQKSAFKLIGGVTYINEGKIGVIAGPGSTYTFGDASFTPEEVGAIDFKADYSKTIAPFVGFGFGRSIPKKRVGVGAEFGLLYTQTPKVSLSGTNRLSDMSEQQNLVQENMKDWRFLPTVNLRVAIRL